MRNRVGNPQNAGRSLARFNDKRYNQNVDMQTCRFHRAEVQNRRKRRVRIRICGKTGDGDKDFAVGDERKRSE